MTKIAWDQVGEKTYETGVDHGVLYLANNAGVYNEGYGWNGLVSVTESPSGAESNKQYADNIVYLNLISAEEFSATVAAYTYPDEFEQCDGSASPVVGISIGQQGRRMFGMSYRTLKGNDTQGNNLGYKLHLIYGAQAAPSERAYNSVNDSPEAIEFSWELSTTPVAVGTINGVDYKPTAVLTLDSTKLDNTALAALEDILYGTAGTDPRLPTPAEVVAMFDGVLTEVTPSEPAYDSATKTITIPNTAGVVYKIGNEVAAAGPVVITEDTVVTATPASGYKFPSVSDDDWFYNF